MRAQEPCFLPPMSSRRCTCAFWLQAKQMSRSRLYRFFQAQDREPCAFPISQIPRPWSTSTRAQARVVTDGVRSKCCGRAVGFVVVVNLQHARQKSQLPADRQTERVPRRLLAHAACEMSMRRDSQGRTHQRTLQGSISEERASPHFVSSSEVFLVW